MAEHSANYYVVSHSWICCNNNNSIVSSMVRIVNYENKLMNGTMKSHTVSVVSWSEWPEIKNNQSILSQRFYFCSLYLDGSQRRNVLFFYLLRFLVIFIVWFKDKKHINLLPVLLYKIFYFWVSVEANILQKKLAM